MYQFAVTITGQSAVVTLSGGTFPSSATLMELWIMQINSAITY